MSAAAVPAAAAVPVPVVASPVVAPNPRDAPGISAKQLEVWREKFEAQVAELADDARSLMSDEKADLIVDLLSSWDSCTAKERRAQTTNYVYFKTRYMLAGLNNSDLIKTEVSGAHRRVVRISKLFDELLPYHLQNNHAKGLGLFKRIGPVKTFRACI